MTRLKTMKAYSQDLTNKRNRQYISFFRYGDLKKYEILHNFGQFDLFFHIRIITGSRIFLKGLFGYYLFSFNH